MIWKKVRLPALLITLIVSTAILIADINIDKNPVSTRVSQNTPEPTFPPIPTTTVQSKVVINQKDKLKPTVTAKPSTTVNQNTAQTNSGNSNSTSSNPTVSNSQAANPTPAPTLNPTAVPVVSTPAPTQQPETVNIQAWIKGWWYSESGNQYSADGDIKIYNGNTLVASGSYNSYEEPYKVSNLPENSTLSIYFYMGTCGQLKYITTGNLSSLQQVDFHFYPSTNCLQ